jgi:uncharacterized protein (DUF1697 family)
MSQYVVFLRAINVGGSRIIRMEDLRRMFESYKFLNVATYIQTGNVIFESDEKVLREDKIEKQLEESLGYNVEVFLRTMKEITEIANHAPFTPKGDETVHVVFLRETPDKKTQQMLLALKSEADDFAVKGKEVYNLRRDRDKSIFSNAFIEKTVKSPATTRNLTTIKKIAEKYNKTT